MTVTQLFTQVNAAYRGSDDDPPTSGTDFTLWLNTANRMQNSWARDGKNVWQSLYDIRSVGTVSTTLTYDLDDQILLPADRVIVTTTAADLVYYTICKPQERDRFLNSCYISGSDPQKLTFVDTIAATDSVYGGTISLAAYYLPDDLTAAGDTILVDDPYWLVLAVAAELAFNDITYSDKSPDLNAKANALYAQMASNNRRGSNNNPRIARTNVNRIISPQSESGVGTI